MQISNRGQDARRQTHRQGASRTQCLPEITGASEARFSQALRRSGQVGGSLRDGCYGAPLVVTTELLNGGRGRHFAGPTHNRGLRRVVRPVIKEREMRFRITVELTATTALALLLALKLLH